MAELNYHELNELIFFARNDYRRGARVSEYQETLEVYWYWRLFNERKYRKHIEANRSHSLHLEPLVNTAGTSADDRGEY